MTVLFGGPRSVPRYKGGEGRAARRSVLERLRDCLAIPTDVAAAAEENDDVLDAVICVLAGADFLRGKAIRPDEAGVPIETAKKEGWIWVRGPKLP